MADFENRSGAYFWVREHRKRESRHCRPASPEFSNTAIPVVTVVLPIAALAAADRAETVDQLDPVQIFRHLVAELSLDTNPQRRAVLDGQRLAVEAVGEDGLR